MPPPPPPPPPEKVENTRQCAYPSDILNHLKSSLTWNERLKEDSRFQ